ncbi:hypothetical protein BX616_003369 [Lobosporangium transversale]|nr:hypothetical protein BX616_003369 [Lobosporangium transversale]
MKFPIIVTAATITLAATTDAYSRVVLFGAEKYGDTCGSFQTTQYEQCMSVTTFNSAKSAAYYHDDPYTDGITLTFYETGNCGGNWTRAGFQATMRMSIGWEILENVYGRVGSVLLHKGIEPSGNGIINQYLPATTAIISNCYDI